MRPFLQFAIPTWNRRSEVEICVRSIAEQITAQVRHVTILVQDDCSTDGTKESIDALQREFPDLIEYRCTAQRTDYSDAFLSLFQSTDSDWTWTFGDDDRLEPGALGRVLGILPETKWEFIHCAEKGRESGSGKAYAGTLLRLCQTFGWLDMTGFITGNIVRTERLLEASMTPRWKLYAKSAFVQSCALLDVLKDSPCAYLDVPLVATQNASQTQECIDRWAADRIGERYLLVADCIQAMFDDEILTDKLSTSFFRYQNFHLWDRHIVYFIHDYLTQGLLNASERWEYQAKLSRFLSDLDFAESLAGEVEMVRGMITLHAYLTENLKGIRAEIEAVQARRGQAVYPWCYLVSPETS